MVGKTLYAERNTTNPYAAIVLAALETILLYYASHHIKIFGAQCDCAASRLAFTAQWPYPDQK